MLIPPSGHARTGHTEDAERMSTSAYDFTTSNAQLPRTGRKASSAAAPNNAGVALLLAALVMVIGIAVFVGAPAVQELRGNASCMSLADGTPADAGTGCHP